jgi:hypothetical protein
MRVTLFNDGTCEIRRGNDRSQHTYVIHPRQDRVQWILDIDGGVDEVTRPAVDEDTQGDS